MNRRNFIRKGSLAGLTLSALAQTSAAPTSGSTINNIQEVDLAETTIDELQQKMQRGELTSRIITDWYLKQIEQIDKNGPKLNSVIEVNPEAAAMADALDAERKEGKVRGPLHGIPILIKDNIDTADKMMTTAGSLALSGNIASKDAFIVQQLRKAGAVILGKTNLSEFANFRSTRSTSAWSSRGGQTKCPYVLNRNPSGSSAGSGTAPAANLCVAAIGTETDGSIVSPASVNCLVGIKPTIGLWSRSGIIPISATQDTAGPMARTVRDAAILLSAMTGIDTADAATKASRGKVHKDYTKFLEADGLKGKRLGVEKSFLRGNPDVVDLLKKNLELLKERGATIVEVEVLKAISPFGDDEYLLLEYEFKDGLNKYLAGANAKVKSLKDVIEYNEKNPRETMPFFKQEILIDSEKKGDLNSKEYKQSLLRSTSARQIINKLMQAHKLDAICGTTNGIGCCIDLVNGDYDTGFSLSSPPARAGFPHITVPMGFIHELPVGFSFFGRPWSEPQLLSLAYAFEQATKIRRAPKFLPEII